MYGFYPYSPYGCCGYGGGYGGGYGCCWIIAIVIVIFLIFVILRPCWGVR